MWRRVAQILKGWRGSPFVLHNSSGSAIGQPHRLAWGYFCAECNGQRGNYGVACASDIEDLHRLCRNMYRRLAFLEKAHAALAAGNEKRVDVNFRPKLLGSSIEVDFILGLTCDGKKLA